MKNYSLLFKSKIVLIISLLSVLTLSCGQAGQKDSKNFSSGKYEGIIGSSMGLYSVLNGWQLVLSEASSKICKLSPIYNGSFVINNVDQNQEATLLLLTPEAKLHAVLAIPDTENPTHVYQYFKSSEDLLPPLILKHPVLNFLRTSTKDINDGDDDSFEISSYFASSKDADGIPDGMKNLPLQTQTVEELIVSTYDGVYNNQIDSDGDGIPNVADNDILGIGVPNLFSVDIDRDGIIDIFDIDANSDLIQDDLQPKTNKYYFNDVIDYFSVQQRYLSSEQKYLMSFKIKINEEDIPLNTITKISVYSITDLFVGSQLYSDSTPWDLTIDDDGKYGDDIQADGLFTRTVILHQRPNDEEIIFIKLETKDNTFFFPYIFSKLKFTPITPIYNKTNNTVTFDNLEPFGNQKGANRFLWSVWVYNQHGTAIFSSPTMKGSTNLTYTLPEYIRPSSNFKIKVFAQSLDQIPGTPAAIIESNELIIE